MPNPHLENVAPARPPVPGALRYSAASPDRGSQYMDAAAVRTNAAEALHENTLPLRIAHGSSGGWLWRSVACLRSIDGEAAEEGYPPVGDVAKAVAKRLLFAARIVPWAPAVYPSMDGEIAIFFKSPDAAAALTILVNDRGETGLYWSSRSGNMRKRYRDSLHLPDDFMKAKLMALCAPALSQMGAAFAPDTVG